MGHNTKKQIIIEATEAFARYGVKGTTMQYLSETLHISKRTLYGCFPDKINLLHECVRQSVLSNLRKIRIGIASRTSLDALLYVIDRAYELLTIPYPDFRSEIIRYAEIRRLLDDRYRIPLSEIVEEQVCRAQEEGQLLPRIEARRFFLLFEGLLAAAVQEPSRSWSRREFFDEIVAITLAGLCTEQGRQYLENRKTQQQTK